MFICVHFRSAYVLAGYRANRSNAARLSANQDIQKRVAEIQSVGAERAVTVDFDVDSRPGVCGPMVKPVCAVVQARSTLHAFAFADPSVTNFITHAIGLGW